MTTQSPTAQQYLDAALAVYSDNVTTIGSDLANPEWTALIDKNTGLPVISSVADEADGFHAQAFINSQGQILIAYEGTKLTDPNNPIYARATYLVDAGYLVGTIPTALFSDATNFLVHVSNIAKQYGDPVIAHALNLAIKRRNSAVGLSG